MIQIIPAIDLIDGRCVRLSQGDYGQKKIYDGDPADLAARYADCGVARIHLVDLDGAKAGVPRNLRTLERIAYRVGVELEWGGGLSSDTALRDAFDAGATQAIIGSVAAREPARFREWLQRWGGERVLLGADVRDGRVAVSGWLEETALGVAELVGSFLVHSRVILARPLREIDLRFDDVVERFLIIARLGACFFRAEHVIWTTFDLLNIQFRRSNAFERFDSHRLFI